MPTDKFNEKRGVSLLMGEWMGANALSLLENVDLGNFDFGAPLTPEEEVYVRRCIRRGFANRVAELTRRDQTT